MGSQAPKRRKGDGGFGTVIPPLIAPGGSRAYLTSPNQQVVREFERYSQAQRNTERTKTARETARGPKIVACCQDM